MMKEIPLTKNTVALVDDEDYERLSKFKWHNNNGYAKRNMPILNSSNYYTFMHWEVLGCPGTSVIDHIDGNKLNNSKSNLRVCTPQQNCWNINKGIRAASGYRGVYRNGSKWHARIKHNGKVKHLGNFNTPEEAAMTYDVAALEYRGDFAQLNYGHGTRAEPKKIAFA